MDRVFWDANVLFSAAYSAAGCFLELWRRKGIRLLTSEYAVQEARRNLTGDGCLKRLEQLTATMEIVPSCAGNLPSDAILDANLPEKDQPILNAAISARATHLLTGDRRHFGDCYGRQIGGVLIQPPAQYLQKKPRPSQGG